MANLKNGSSGSEVEKLQNMLISAGYDVGKSGADGIFGPDTEKGVMQYQKDHGLAVDGIAGPITLGSLNGGNKNNLVNLNNTNTNTVAGTGGGNAGAVNDVPIVKDNVSANEVAGTPKVEEVQEATNAYVPTPFTRQEFGYTPFEKSDTVKQADAMLAELMANKPGAWSDPYYNKYMGYLNQYENRDPFSYDVNSDALYQQYKDQYIQQGQLAMMDTMGQAAAMTGGYGNSYAQAVGQQAYNQQLNQLNEIVPELYNMAYNRYNQEGQELLNLYSLYNGLSEQDYNKYLGELDRYYNDVNVARNYANDLLQNEFNVWSTSTQLDFDTWNANTGYAFDEWKTTEGMAHTSSENDKNRQWQTEENDKTREEDNKDKTKDELIDLIKNHGYQPTDDELAAAGITKAQAEAYAKSYADNQAEKDEDKKTEAWKTLMTKIQMGYTPTDDELAAAGMTRDEAATYADYFSNNSGTTGTTNKNDTTDTPEYEEFPAPGSTAYNYMVGQINKAESLDELSAITSEYIRKYGEDAIRNLTAFQRKLEELTPKTGGVVLNQGLSIGGGSGGGTSYFEMR